MRIICSCFVEAASTSAAFSFLIAEEKPWHIRSATDAPLVADTLNLDTPATPSLFARDSHRLRCWRSWPLDRSTSLPRFLPVTANINTPSRIRGAERQRSRACCVASLSPHHAHPILAPSPLLHRLRSLPERCRLQSLRTRSVQTVTMMPLAIEDTAPPPLRHHAFGVSKLGTFLYTQHKFKCGPPAIHWFCLRGFSRSQLWGRHGRPVYTAMSRAAAAACGGAVQQLMITAPASPPSASCCRRK